MDEITKVQYNEKIYSRLNFYPYKYPSEERSCDMCGKSLFAWNRILSIPEKDLDFCPDCDKKLFKLVQIASCALPQLQKMCGRDYSM